MNTHEYIWQCISRCKGYVTSQRTGLADLFVFSWFVVLSCYLVNQRIFPYLFNDEYGVLGAAAVFSGLEWSTPANTPFYGFVLSLLTFPLYWLSIDPTTIYRGVLLVNGLLLAFSAVLALRTIRLFSDDYSVFWRIGAVIVAFSYPAVLHYATMALGETTLLCCLFVITYNLAVLFTKHEKMSLNAFFLGVSVALAPYAHTRGAILVISLAIVASLAFALRWISFKIVGVTLFTAISSSIPLRYLKSYLLENFYDNAHLTTSSVSNFAKARIRIDLLEPERLIALGQVAFGQLTYLLTSSFGLVFLGFIGIAAVFWHFSIRSKESVSVRENTEKVHAISALFIGLTCILMFSVSVLQTSSPRRADQFFYGRYNEVMMPALILFALLYIKHLPRLKLILWLSVPLLLALFGAWGIRYYPLEPLQKYVIYSNITSWFIHTQGIWKIVSATILEGTLIGCLLIILAGAISRILFIITMICFFLSATLYNFENMHMGADADIGIVYAQLGKAYHSDLAGKNIYLSYPPPETIGEPILAKEMIEGMALQFAVPNARVKFHENDSQKPDAIFDFTGAHPLCSQDTIVSQVRQGNLCVPDIELRNNMREHPFLDDLPVSARTRPPAVIRIDEHIGFEGIRSDSIVTRAWAWTSEFFYTRWLRYWLPSMAVYVSRPDLIGNEQQVLGIFITGEQGQWINQWREKLNLRKLADGTTVSVRVPVWIKSDMAAGNYMVHFAIIDNDGWDWRSVKSMNLIIPYRKEVLSIGPTLDSPILFSDESCSLRRMGGWSQPESWGIWTEGEWAVLGFDRYKFPETDLELIAKVEGFTAENHPEQSVDIWTNGVQIGTWIFAHGEGMVRRRVLLPAEVIAIHQPLTLSFHIKSPVSPSSLGLAEDERRLGIGIQKITFCPVAPVQMSTLFDHPISFSESPCSIQKLTGWSHPESWGLWTNGEWATVSFDRYTFPEADIGVLADVRGFTSEGHPEQIVDILANDIQVGTWTFAYGEELVQRSVVLPAEVVAKRQPLMLSFHVKLPVSPLSLGISDDPRQLGIGIQSVMFRLAKPTDNAESPDDILTTE